MVRKVLRLSLVTPTQHSLPPKHVTVASRAVFCSFFALFLSCAVVSCRVFMAFVINRLLHRDPTACRTFFQWIYLYAANPRGCSSAWLLIRVAAHTRWPFIRVAAHPLWLAGLLVALAGYGGSCWSLWVALLPAESTTCSTNWVALSVALGRGCARQKAMRQVRLNALPGRTRWRGRG